VEASLVLVKELKTEAYRAEVQPAVEARILEALTGPGAAEDTVESFRSLLRAGALEDREVAVEVPARDGKGGPAGAAGGPAGPLSDIDVSVAGGMGVASIDLGEFMQRIMPGARGKPQSVRRSIKVKEARGVLEEAEIERRLASQDLRREAVQ
jgi:ATP-dependent HslUV protease ATP-binding subunit HslU